MSPRQKTQQPSDPSLCLPPTGPARCHGGGIGGRSPLHECPSRLPEECPPWQSIRCAILDAPRDANKPVTDRPTLSPGLQLPRVHDPQNLWALWEQTLCSNVNNSGEPLLSRSQHALQAEAGLRLTSPPEPPSPGPEAGAKTPSPRLWAIGTVVTGNVRGWTRLQQRGPRGHGGSEAVRPPAPWLHTGRVPEGKSRAQRPTRLFGVWVPRTGQGAAAARVRPPVQPRAFPGAHLSPRAWPGRLAWLGGFPQGKVVGGPLLTQAVCRDAQVTCGHKEAGHPVLPGGQNHVTARPPLGATGQHFEFPLISLVSPRLH